MAGTDEIAARLRARLDRWQYALWLAIDVPDLRALLDERERLRAADDKLTALMSTYEAAEASLREAVEVMRKVEPYLDAIICYASTMSEHEPNRIANAFRAFLAKMETKP